MALNKRPDIIKKDENIENKPKRSQSVAVKQKSNTIIDVSKALELKMKKGLSYQEVGKYFNVSRQAVEQRLKPFLGFLKDSGEIDAYATHKGEILQSVEMELMTDMLDTDKRKKASLNNIAYALGQVNNMNRLENNQSTANISYNNMSDSLEEIRARRIQLEESINEMQ